MNAEALGRRILSVLEVFTLGGLLATREVDLRIAIWVAALAVLRGLGVRVRRRGPLVVSLVVLIAAAVTASLHYRFHPLVSAAHGAILAHCALWLGPAEVRDRVLRLAMSFVELVLACALTTDFYLLPLISLAAVLGSLYVSTAFLESSLREQAPAIAAQPVPRGFVMSIMGLAVSVFAASLVLFPIVPRVSWRSDDLDTASTAAYREVVELNPSAPHSIHQSIKPVITITRLKVAARKGASDISASLPMHLLRGNDLEMFDGTRWFPRTSKRVAAGVEAPRPAPIAASGDLHVELEPDATRHVFLPYGARLAVASQSTEGASPTSGPAPLTYDVALDAREIDPVLLEKPYDIHTRLPAATRTPALVATAARVFAGARSPREHVAALARLFSHGFEPVLAEGPQAADPAELIDTFLNREHTGNCELFATSTAVLLRLAGLPSRVIAGYRPLRSTTAGALTVTQGDAHAWVEYWDPERAQWRAFDPTPVRLAVFDWLEPVRQAYWKLDNLWDEWVLNYRHNGRRATPPSTSAPSKTASVSPQTTDLSLLGYFKEPLHRMVSGDSPLYSAAGLLALGAVLALAVRAILKLLGRRRSKYGPVSPGVRALQRECEAMTRVLKTLVPTPEELVSRPWAAIVGERYGPTAAAHFAQWDARWVRLRFGPPTAEQGPRPLSAALDELASLRRAVARALRTPGP